MRSEPLRLLQNGKHSVKITNIGVFRFPSHYKFESHAHKEIEINYVDAGHCVMEISGEYITFKKGDCIIIYSDVRHSFMVNKKQSCRLIQLEFQLEFANDNFCLSFLDEVKSEKPFRKCSEFNDISNYIEVLLRINNRDDGECKEELLNLQFLALYLMLSEKIDSKSTKVPSNCAKFNFILEHINNNFTSELIMEQICEQYNVSSRYIRKMFDQNLGMGSSNYIKVLRINKAKELLWNFELSITDIAYICGFSSSQYFSRVFKDITSMTPVEYRKCWSKK